MTEQLDELKDPVMDSGREINVIARQQEVKVGWGSLLFQILLWFPLIIPGLIFLFVKISAGKYLSQLEQRIQHNASQVDNFLEQRVVILQNVAGIVKKAIDFDKETMTNIARFRSGASASDNIRNDVQTKVDGMLKQINVAVENYPDLKAHSSLQDAMQQNSNLQKEITAARELYNDTVNQWNRAVYEWPAKQIVAAKRGYKTRIPFATSQEYKQRAREQFF